MELSWPMKLRIAAAAAVGVVLIGILARPFAEPFSRIGAMGYKGSVVLVVLAFLSGLMAYFASWPYGREIGILAAPSGLAIWAVRSGSMAGLIQLNPTVGQRQELAASLQWEPVFWLAVVAAGFAGVMLGQKIKPGKNFKEIRRKSKPGPGLYLNAIIALACSTLLAQIFIRIFAQDVRVFDKNLGSVVTQPAVGQIVFAVLLSFGLAAFIVQKFLNASYIWPSIASVFVTAFALGVYARQVQYLVPNWPATFFSNSVVSILPVQMVAFGTLGSVAGYWMAFRYDYWRKNEAK